MLVVALSAVSLCGQTYFVSPGGVDGNPGSAVQPWRTIARANQVLAAGDTVFIREGVYHEVINPANSGTSGNEIVYKRFGTDDVVIDGPGNTLEIVVLFSDFVVVEGLTIRNQAYLTILGVSAYWIRLEGNHLTIRNCRIIADGDPRDVYWVQGAMSRGIVSAGSFNTVEGCFIRGQQMGVVIAGGAPRYCTLRYDTLNANGASNVVIISPTDGSRTIQGNVIEHCVMDTSFEEDNIQFEPNYADHLTPYNRGTIIRDNKLGHAAENCVDLKGGEFILIENNLLYGSTGDDNGLRDGPDDIGGAGIELGHGDVARYVIARGNVIWDNHTGAHMYEGFHYYSNTLLNNRRSFRGSNYANNDVDFGGLATYNMPGYERAFVNNIVAGQPNKGVFNWLMDGGDKFYLNNNLYYDTPAAIKFFHRENGSLLTTTGLANWRTELNTYYGYSYMGGKDANSIEADPQFANAPIYPVDFNESWDFSLRSTSPAIDAGRPLAVATNGGNNSTTLTVDDPYFFCDGYGVSAGDLIRIGTADSVRISSINYDTRTIGLESPRSWANGDGVSTDYRGLAPDIGAFEFVGGTSEVTAPSVPSLSAPPDNATGMGVSVRLEWTSASRARAYDLQVSIDPNFANLSLSKADLPGTSYSLSQLGDSTIYYWRVRASNSAGPSDWSQPRKFTTMAKPHFPPLPPTLVRPSDGESSVSTEPLLLWNASPRATSYHVQMSTEPNFFSPLIDNADIPDTTYQVYGLESSNFYYWRVNASNDLGTSDWSPPQSYATIADAQSPNVIRNSDFSSRTSYWRFYSNGFGDFGVSSPGYDNPSCGKATISQQGTNVQLYQAGLPLEPDTVYILTFSAYSNTGHAMDVALFKDQPPYVNYGLAPHRADLTTAWKSFAFEFTTSGFRTPVRDGELQFWLAPYAVGGDIYYFDNIKVTKKQSQGAPQFPRDFSIDQNFPNPFNPIATIRYQIPFDCMVKMQVHDILGRLVQTLIWSNQKAGKYAIDFNGAGLASGVYFCTLHAGSFVQTIKMMLVK